MRSCGQVCVCVCVCMYIWVCEGRCEFVNLCCHKCATCKCKLMSECAQG